MLEEDQLLKTIKPEIHKWLDYAHGVRFKVIKRTDLPQSYGYYCIMANKPLPPGSRTITHNQDTHNGLYLWRDGVGSIRDAVGTRHLFRTQQHRRDGSKPNSFKVTQQPLHLFTNADKNNFTPVGDGINGYENGIDINEPQWNDYNFYIAYIKAGMLANVIEQEARNYIGFPQGNLQRKK